MKRLMEPDYNLRVLFLQVLIRYGLMLDLIL